MKCCRLLEELIDHTDVGTAVHISLVKRRIVKQLQRVPGFQNSRGGSPEVLLNALKHTCALSHPQISSCR